MKKIEMKKNKRRTLPIRYINIFMLFFTFFLVFLAVSSITYVSSTQKVRDTVKKQVSQSLESDVKIMDTYIQRAYGATNNFLSKVSVYTDVPPTGKYSREDYLEIPKLIEQLAEFYYSVSDYANQVYFFSNTRQVLTPQGSYDFDIYFDKIYKHKNYNSDFWKKYDANRETILTFPVDEVEKSNQFVTQKVIPLVATRRKQDQMMTMVTEINAVTVSDMMKSYSSLPKQSILCLDKNKNVFINTTREEFSPEDIDKLYKIASTGNEATITEKYRIGSKNYFLCSMKGLEDIRYFLFTPESEVNQTVYQQNRYMLLFFGCIMVLLFILTLLYSSKLFNPIKDILNSIDSFKNIENNDQMVNSNQILKEKNEIIYSYVNSYVSSYIKMIKPPNQSEFEQYLFENTDLYKENLTCLIIDFNFNEAYSEEFTQGQQSTIETMLSNVLKAIFNCRFYTYITQSEGNRFICFFNSAIDTRQQLQTALINLKEVFSYDYRYCDILAGISMPVSGNDDVIYSAVSQAFAAISKSYVEKSTDTAFIVVDYDSEGVKHRPVLIQNDISRVYNLMRLGKRADLFQAVDEILAENIKQNVHYETMQMIVNRLYAVGMDYLLSCNIDSHTVSSEFWDGLDIDKHNLNSYQQLLKGFLGHCIEVTSPSSGIENENLNEVFMYITNHYHEMLYLDLIAQRVNMSPKYLSRIFKNKIGITITEYISLVRITKAKELLLSSDKKIDDIGLLVGFDNRTTFFRLFKKLEGVSPSKYRKDNI